MENHMPFRSDSQRRLFYAKMNRGEISPSTVKHWEKATGDKDLPEKIKKKKASLDPITVTAFFDELSRLNNI
jgi:hypothetical protein